MRPTPPIGWTPISIAMAAMHTWPNIAFHASVFRWTDERGRTTDSTYQEMWYDDYQRAMTARPLAAAPTGG